MRIAIKAVIICFISSGAMIGQASNEQRAINNYVSFINESIHGLLIAHRLFENYNQSINKYVDLPEYQLNNYSNADLPDNIFVDPEHWFYDRSPIEWHTIARREGKFLGGSSGRLNQEIDQIKYLLDIINEKRKSIQVLIESRDFTQSENLKAVYDELEGVVALYDQFYDRYQRVDKLLNELFRPSAKSSEDYRTFQTSFVDAYNPMKSQLDILRKEGNPSTEDIAAIGRKVLELEKRIPESDEYLYKRVMTNVTRLVRSFTDFINGKDIPQEYQLYGRHYFYYNIEMLNKINRYGNGFAKDYNEKAAENDAIFVTEIPQRFKVIYPEKLPKENLEKLDDTNLIKLLDKSTVKEELVPVEIEGRNIIVHHERIIIDSSSFELDLYDHLIKDGDRVSININGEWKFRNISLEKAPQSVTIDIVPGKQNYILVHADNTGYRPPNTIALSYMYKGERKQITLESDLKNSQMIEILYESTPP